MLTSIPHREVITGGVTETNAFTIKANGKAFKTLIDGLYSNKIVAIIRELWTNAFDSHVAAGCGDRPFDCQLPTFWDPVFRVRDYGVSLSHEDVMHLYTTVFESTKDGTNAQVGKLGLGSKSPFAYTDTFTVTAWLEGEKRTYSAYIGSDHIPVIAFMGAEASAEDSGLEVSFPVQVGDVGAFLKAARRVAYGFDVRPNIIGGQELNVDHPTIVMSDLPLWQLVIHPSGWYGAYAKQGCVLYPIDPDAIPNITDLQRAVLSSSFVIEFPIGDLEISASREALGYDAPTRRNILRAADVIAADIRARYEDTITSSTTYWEALVAYNGLLSSGLEDGIKSILGAGLTWRGRKLQQQFSMSPLLERAGVRGVTDGGVAATKIDAKRANKVKVLKWSAYKHFTVHPLQTVFYFDDVTKPTGRAGDRIKYHRECNLRLNDTSVVWLKADPTSYAWRRLYAALGRPPLVSIADLPKPPASAKGYRAGRRVPVRAMGPDSSDFVETTITESDRVVYVRMRRGDLVKPDSYYAGIREVRTLSKRLRALGYMQPDEPVVAIPDTHKRLPARNAHWVRLWDLAVRAVDERYDCNACARAAAMQDVLDDRQPGALALVRSLLAHDEGFQDERAPAARLLARYAALKDRLAEGTPGHQALLVHQISLITGQRVKAPSWVTKNPISPYLIAVEERYPLFAYLLPAWQDDINDEKRKAVVDYVNLVDSSHSCEQSAAKAA